MKLLTLTSLLTLALAAPTAFAQTGDNTPPPARNAPTVSPAPGNATTAPATQPRKKKGGKRKNTDATKQAPAAPQSN